MGAADTAPPAVSGYFRQAAETAPGIGLVSVFLSQNHAIVPLFEKFVLSWVMMEPPSRTAVPVPTKMPMLLRLSSVMSMAPAKVLQGAVRPHGKVPSPPAPSAHVRVGCACANADRAQMSEKRAKAFRLILMLSIFVITLVCVG